MIQINGLEKSYGTLQVLKGINLEIADRSVISIVGASGAGKSTLLHLIGTLDKPDKGKVLIDGEPLHPQHVERIGYLPEDRGLYKKMKVGEQAIYLAQLKGIGKAEATRRLKAWFDRFEIGEWWDKKVEELSKGMQQKVQFITTVIHEPDILIFDEPFSGFDPINANLLKESILELREQGATILLSTHNMNSVEEMCDSITLINKGEKILEGRVDDIKAQHRLSAEAPLPSMNDIFIQEVQSKNAKP